MAFREVCFRECSVYPKDHGTCTKHNNLFGGPARLSKNPSKLPFAQLPHHYNPLGVGWRNILRERPSLCVSSDLLQLRSVEFFLKQSKVCTGFFFKVIWGGFTKYTVLFGVQIRCWFHSWPMVLDFQFKTTLVRCHGSKKKIKQFLAVQAVFDISIPPHIMKKHFFHLTTYPKHHPRTLRGTSIDIECIGQKLDWNYLPACPVAWVGSNKMSRCK